MGLSIGIYFKATLSSHETQTEIKRLLLAGENEDTEGMMGKVNNILDSAAKSTLKQKKHSKNNKRNNKKWFDTDCFVLRREVIKLGRRLCRPGATHLQRMVFW